MYHTFCIVLC